VYVYVYVCGVGGSINFYVGTTDEVSYSFVRYVIDYEQSIFNYNTIILLCLFHLLLDRRKNNDNTEALYILLEIRNTMSFRQNSYSVGPIYEKLLIAL
jgi:hypothetical protein